jgi:hypothetical protein
MLEKFQSIRRSVTPQINKQTKNCYVIICAVCDYYLDVCNGSTILPCVVLYSLGHEVV